MVRSGLAARRTALATGAGGQGRRKEEDGRCEQVGAGGTGGQR
jgi:hypothetical protein